MPKSSLILTLALDEGFFDGKRRRYFPPERTWISGTSPGMTCEIAP